VGYGLTRIQCSVLCCCVCCFIFNAAAGRFLQMLMPIADHIWLHQFSCHLSQCFTPKHHSLLEPRLPNPCRLRGPRVGGMAKSPLRSRASPTRGQKMGKGGDIWENEGGDFARRATHTEYSRWQLVSGQSIRTWGRPQTTSDTQHNDRASSLFK